MTRAQQVRQLFSQRKKSAGKSEFYATLLPFRRKIDQFGAELLDRNAALRALKSTLRRLSGSDERQIPNSVPW